MLAEDTCSNTKSSETVTEITYPDPKFELMNFELIPATQEHVSIIKNLLQFYMYDFSEYTEWDVENDGLFRPYPGLEEYWEKGNTRFPYIIKKDEKYIGFALIKLIESEERNYFSVAEFFIVKKYRRKGIGKSAMQKIFDLHKGQWEVYQKENNKPARLFWNNVISGYTSGRFKERLENGRSIQDFENYF